MGTRDKLDRVTAGRAVAVHVRAQILDIPPNFFSIPFGLAGLAGVWHMAASLNSLPAAVGDVLYLMAAAVYLPLVAAFAARLLIAPRAVAAGLEHPVTGPFNAVLPIVGMLLALGLQPHAPECARALFLAGFVATLLLGGWLTGQWIVEPIDIDQLHPGYFLPTVAGGLIGAQGAAAFGLAGLGWLSFGIGIISWLVLGSMLVGRLIVRPALPAALVPTLAILLAPPAVAGNAYFALTGGRPDPLAHGLAGFAVLMGVVQVRLLPLYLRLPFAPTFWSFTFSYAAAAADALRWIALEHPSGASAMSAAVLTIITALVTGVALRSLVALQRGTFLPAQPTEGAAGSAVGLRTERQA